MRLSPAAAALVLLALGAASCKPSSLTPFGIGTREPETSTGINGGWEGLNSTGGAVTFDVGNDTVSNLLMRHDAGSCTWRLLSGDARADITGDEFTLEVFYTQGRLVLDGRFTSSTACTGSYYFQGLVEAVDCPTTGSGTFSVAKTQ